MEKYFICTDDNVIKSIPIHMDPPKRLKRCIMHAMSFCKKKKTTARFEACHKLFYLSKNPLLCGVITII